MQISYKFAEIEKRRVDIKCKFELVKNASRPLGVVLSLWIGLKKNYCRTAEQSYANVNLNLLSEDR